MNKIILISILILVVGNIYAADASNDYGAVKSFRTKEVKHIAPVAKEIMPLLRDGFAFPNSGVEGLINKSRKSGKWFFTPYTNISDTRVTVFAGYSIELLPSSTLEKIIGMMSEAPKRSSTMEVKLWGKVTKYSNVSSSRKLYFGKKAKEGEIFVRNYIFPLNFIPITSVENSTKFTLPDKTKDKQPENSKSIMPQEAKDLLKTPKVEPKKIQTDKPKTNSIMPQDVKDIFKLERVENLSKWEKNTIVDKDVSMTNRTGFITQGDAYKIFTIDAMGRSINNTSFKLLPCETLQRTERVILTSPGRNRYKISGTITMFKGEKYMLLQRTVKTYNHQNFAP
jgi:hypothetical protein